MKGRGTHTKGPRRGLFDGRESRNRPSEEPPLDLILLRGIVRQRDKRFVGDRGTPGVQVGVFFEDETTPTSPEPQ